MFYSLPQSEAKSKKVKSHGQVIVFGRVRAGASLARSSPGPHLANISLFFRFLSFMGHSLFFRPALNAFPDIGSVGRIEKGNLKKKYTGILWIGSLVPQHYCCGARRHNPESIMRERWLMLL